MKFTSKKKIIISLFVLLVIGLSFYWVTDQMKQRKFAHEATATMMRKEFVKGTTRDDDEWKIYYRIDDLGMYGKAAVKKTEEERYHRGEYRETEKSKAWGDHTHVGDRLGVLYRWAGGSEIEILYVGNPKLEDQR